MTLLDQEDVEELAQSRELCGDLTRGFHVKTVLAIERQTRLAQAFRDVPHHRALGELELVVDPWLIEEMKRRHGEDCWRDPDFRRAFAKANPECAPKNRSRKTMIIRP